MKPDWWYPTAFSIWGDEERHAWNIVQKSGRYTMGPRVEAFEEAFARYHGKKYGIMCNSGSSANLLMVATLCSLQNNPLRVGDIALVPAIAWSTTYAPIYQHGLHIRLLDCDNTWNANDINQPDISPGWNLPPRLVVGCSILGNPANLANLQKQANAIGAYMIEDNCESFDARSPYDVGNTLCGSYGVMSSFSFFYSHQISAIEGGMVLTDNKEMATLCRMLRAHGWSRDIEPPAHFDQEYDFRIFGYNLRPLELHAAIAHVQLNKQALHRKLRKQNVQLFDKAGLPIKRPLVYGDTNPFGIAFTVEKDKRAPLVRALRRASIDCRLPTGGSFRMHKYGEGHRGQRTPNADYIHEAGLFLGNGPLDLSEQIGTAVAIMKEVLHA